MNESRASAETDADLLAKSLKILADSTPILYLFALFGLVAMLTSILSLMAIVKSKEMKSKFYALYAEMAVVDFLLGVVFIGENLWLKYIIFLFRSSKPRCHRVFLIRTFYWGCKSLYLHFITPAIKVGVYNTYFSLPDLRTLLEYFVLISYILTLIIDLHISTFFPKYTLHLCTHTWPVQHR